MGAVQLESYHPTIFECYSHAYNAQHSFHILSPWLLVFHCLLLADQEFMLWPLFTGKNVLTCVWDDMPFV